MYGKLLKYIICNFSAFKKSKNNSIFVTCVVQLCTYVSRCEKQCSQIKTNPIYKKEAVGTTYAWFMYLFSHQGPYIIPWPKCQKTFQNVAESEKVFVESCWQTNQIIDTTKT